LYPAAEIRIFWVLKGSSPSSAGRHTGVQIRPAAGPRRVVDETFGC
jgi:hypothetical protein